MFLVFGTISLWVAFASFPNTVEVFDQRNVSLAWGALFLSSASFTNAGLSPLSDSIVALKSNTGALTLIAILTFAGNTGTYPLRLLVFDQISLIRC